MSNVGKGAESAGGVGATPAETDKYGACGVIFPTVRGKCQHERLVHPELYHGTRIHLVTKSGWTGRNGARSS